MRGIDDLIRDWAKNLTYSSAVKDWLNARYLRGEDVKPPIPWHQIELYAQGSPGEAERLKALFQKEFYKILNERTAPRGRAAPAYYRDLAEVATDDKRAHDKARTVQKDQSQNGLAATRATHDTLGAKVSTTVSKSQSLSYEHIQKAMQHVLKAEDAVVIVIRGHILIENLLDECLQQYLRGGLTPFAGATFKTKIRLAYAIGLLNDDERQLFAELNKIRNSLAHRLDAYLTAADESRIKQRLMTLAPDLGEYSGHVVYQTLILVLFTIMIVRAEDIGEQVLPLIAKPRSKEYSERLYKNVLVPILTAMDPKDTSVVAFLGLVFVLAIINGFWGKRPVAADSDKGDDISPS